MNKRDAKDLEHDRDIRRLFDYLKVIGILLVIAGLIGVLNILFSNFCIQLVSR